MTIISLAAGALRGPLFAKHCVLASLKFLAKQAASLLHFRPVLLEVGIDQEGKEGIILVERLP